MTALESLSVAVSDILEIDAVSDLTKLDSLDIAQTKVTSLEPLRELRSLTRLEANRTPLRSLAPVWELPLASLEIYATKIKPAEVARFVAEHPRCKVKS